MYLAMAAVCIVPTIFLQSVLHKNPEQMTSVYFHSVLQSMFAASQKSYLQDKIYKKYYKK